MAFTRHLQDEKKYLADIPVNQLQCMKHLIIKLKYFLYPVILMVNEMPTMPGGFHVLVNIPNSHEKFTKS